MAPGRRGDEADYAPVERGLELQCRLTPGEKLRFVTILCERPWFEPMTHARIISGLDRVDGVVWYNYNEVITSSCDLKQDKKMRQTRLAVMEEFGI